MVVAVKYIVSDPSNVMVQTVDDLRKMYPDTMVLASIPDMRLSEKKNGYYSTYYAKEEEEKRNGRSQRA